MADEAREWPEAEVERAAEWLYDFARRDRGYDGGDWHTLTPEFKDGWRGKARAVLEASGAVPRAEHERVKAERDEWLGRHDQRSDGLERAESQLAAVRAEVDELRDFIATRSLSRADFDEYVKIEPRAALAQHHEGEAG